MKIPIILFQKNYGSILIIFSIVNFFPSFIDAQGWEGTYGGAQLDKGNSVIVTQDGGFLITGETMSFGAGGTDLFILKTDANGDSLWFKTFGGESGEFGNSVQQTTDGGYIISGTTNSFGNNSEIYLLKIDASGNSPWTKTIGTASADQGYSVQQTSDGGYIVAGSSLFNQNMNVYLVKTDSEGSTLWIKNYDISGSETAYSVDQTTDGGFIIAGFININGQTNSDYYVIRTNAIGDTLWTKTFGGEGSDYARWVEQTSDGGFLIAGSSGSFNSGSYLVRLDSNGTFQWSKTYGNPDFEGKAARQTMDGGYILLSNSASDLKINLTKTNSNGDSLWTRKFGKYMFNEGFSLLQKSDGGFIISGHTTPATINESNIYLISTDSLGYSITDFVSGKIFNDSDCLSDSTEMQLPGFLVKINPGSSVNNSDNNGNYSFLVDTGTYFVETISPNIYWQLSCPAPPTYTVNFSSFYDTSYANDFGFEIAIYCPLLTVDISTWALRPCMQSTYTLKYCNNGTIPADNAYIEVEFDDDISPVSSSLQWSSVNGNVYTFYVGTVGVNQCSNFYISADVSCNAVLGRTHCIEAHIYPDSICNPIDSAWDKSSMMIEGICFADSLDCFTIYNKGEDMDGTSQWRIYENNVLIETGTFQLTSGDSLVICRPALGSTIRLEADQRPLHPGNSHPNANVEMCGGVSTMGFITQQPEDDFAEFVEMDCRQITASSDPNEKLVKPSGIGSNHFIDSTDILEYQINFQNTGTDTAFRVVIRDTLTQNLDITTIQSGAGSHPYSYRIYGHGILEWTFNNILLPDSNTNEALSHGFVQFKAKQKAGNTIGTIIENRAAIYFDYNAPVITNTAFNTVWKEQIVNVLKIYEANVGIVVYPNPFTDATTIVTPGEKQSLYFALCNLLGEEIRTFEIQNNSLHLERDGLRAGIYIYKVFSNEGLVGAGKLIAE